MSYNYNPDFYNKFRGNNDATFHCNYQPHFVPPPPPPPAFFIPPTQLEDNDQEFLKNYEHKCNVRPPVVRPRNLISISEVKEKLHKIITCLNDLKVKEKQLSDNINVLSNEEWSSHMKEIDCHKSLIDNTLAHIKGPTLDLLNKLLAKRAVKRTRLKRVCSEIKKENEDRIKELKERSRKIDENLQKIKDEITQKQQEQTAKLKADIVLKEVLRKKHDAKKCLVKLDGLVALRRARQNTVKGRGQVLSDNESTAFVNGIDNLKKEWNLRLSSYESEESQLREKLKEASILDSVYTNVTEREVASNLHEWKEVMFGGELPQVDFKGDVTRFIAVRSEWDRYINNEGTTLPVGWVPPSKQSSTQA